VCGYKRTARTFEELHTGELAPRDDALAALAALPALVFGRRARLEPERDRMLREFWLT
jgi:hypothetical protein